MTGSFGYPCGGILLPPPAPVLGRAELALDAAAVWITAIAPLKGRVDHGSLGVVEMVVGGGGIVVARRASSSSGVSISKSE